MTTLQKIKNNWLDFGLSFLEIADLACQEMQKSSPSKNISDLYIATIYNVKHGIEVLLKSIIVILEDKELIKKDETHDQKALFLKICNVANLPDVKKVIAELVKNKNGQENFIFLSEKTQNLGKQFISMGNLIYKYQHLDFLKNKIGDNFIIEDSNNTTFKYPQNNLNIKLDYEEILKKLNNEDIANLNIDINKLITIFISLYLVFSKYIDTKKLKC